MPNASLTCVDLWCKGGSYFENEGEEGLAHFLEHMIFKGSSTLKEGEFDKRIEALGGSSNAATGLDDVHYYVLVPENAVSEAINLLLNLALTPSIEENTYLLEREVVLEEIAQYKDQPEEKIFQILLEKCWPNHPYGRSILGFEKALNSIMPSEMRRFHQRQYRPENLCLGIAGHIPEDIENILNKSELSKIKNSNLENPFRTGCLTPSFSCGRKEIEIKRLESSRITMAWPLPPASNQLMIIGGDIATSLLAEGRSSRLVRHLRENLQIVDSIEMDITPLEQGSLVILEASCLENNLDKVEREINLILKDCLINKPSNKEIARAKQLVNSSICFGLELPAQITGTIASQTLWNRDQTLLGPIKLIDYWESESIQSKLLTRIQPECSYTLIARAAKKRNK